jgi:hypothetical protein
LALFRFAVQLDVRDVREVVQLNRLEDVVRKICFVVFLSGGHPRSKISPPSMNSTFGLVEVIDPDVQIGFLNTLVDGPTACLLDVTERASIIFLPVLQILRI